MRQVFYDLLKVPSPAWVHGCTAKLIRDKGLADSYIAGLDPDCGDLRLIIRSRDLIIGEEIMIPPAGSECSFTLRIAAEENNRDSGRRRRVPVEKHRLFDWLRAQEERNGFELLTAKVTANMVRWVSRDANYVSQDAVFRGRLRVVDAERFTEMMARGIGRRRTFGFGMMQLN